MRASLFCSSLMVAWGLGLESVGFAGYGIVLMVMVFFAMDLWEMLGGKL